MSPDHRWRSSFSPFRGHAVLQRLMAGEDAATAAKCGACGQAYQGGIHACKQCQAPLHSYILCDLVWMPVADAYFCNKNCLVVYNTANEAAYHELAANDPRLQVLKQTPNKTTPGE